MFGIGLPEFIIMLVIALIAIGPERLPDVLKVIGRTFGEFKKATDELRQSVNDTVGDVKNDAKVDLGVEIEEVLKLNEETPDDAVPPVPPGSPVVSVAPSAPMGERKPGGGSKPGKQASRSGKPATPESNAPKARAGKGRKKKR